MTKKNTRHLRAVAFALAGALSCAANPANVQAAPTQTAAKSRVTIALTAFKVVRDKEGRESLASASSARPGDTIEYRALTTNSSTRSLSNLHVRVPVPAGLIYIPNSPRPEAAEASTNGGIFGSIPLQRVTRDANGAQKIVAVPFAEYRVLRWTISSLAPGKSVLVSARARLVNPAAASARKAPAAKKEDRP